MAEAEGIGHVLGGKSIAGLPNWAILAAVGGGLLIGFFFLRSQGNPLASAPADTGTSAPTDVNLDGAPGAPAPTPPVSSYPAPIATGLSLGTTRPSEAGTKGPNASWDAKHAGVPLFKTPAPTSVVSYVPFSSPVVVTGVMVGGQPNNGISTYYPVVGGYMSTYDVSVPQSFQNNPGAIGGQGKFYTAVAGDTSPGIAAANGISLTQFIEWNGVAYPILIAGYPPQPGWTLRVG